MPLFEPLKNIIEEPSESNAISLLEAVLNQNPALLNEVDENGNNLLMNAILLKKSELTLSILKFMDDIGFDNREHRNRANKNALLLVIDNELSTVAKELVTFRGTFLPGFFAGSVEQGEGNRFVQELNIFKEYKKASSPLHGMEIHRLQWRLIMLAAEGKRFLSISEEDIPKLLQASVNLYKSNMSLWVYFFDAYPPTKGNIRDIGFSCPEVVHSMLLFSKLHYLASCLFEKYTKNLEFLAEINGHNSSIREYVLFDLWRAKSFTLLRSEQSPLSYYSREEIEFYHEKYPLNDNPPNDYQYIFFKKGSVQATVDKEESLQLK